MQLKTEKNSDILTKESLPDPGSLQTNKKQNDPCLSADMTQL